jgi:TRAP transporter TAXI family solute receptor
VGIHRRTLITASVGLAAAGCGADGDADLPARDLRIATGNEGGVYVAYGEGLASAVRADLPRLRPTVLRTQASVENLRLLASGRADVAFALADAAADAVNGTGPFLEALPIAALARLYDNYVQIVVRRGAPFRGIRDLAGHRVATGSPKSGTALVAGRMLQAADLGPTDIETVSLDLKPSVEELAAGRIDAFFWSGGLPADALLGLVRTTDVRLLDLADIAEPLAATYGDVYAEAVIPATAYGFGEPITTVSVPNYLVVRPSEDDEVAYRLTRLLFDAQDRIATVHPEARRLNLRSAISTYPVELHPGAERHYRQAKD